MAGVGAVYDPIELQGPGALQVACPGPETLAVLHFPSTASSGRNETCLISGFE